MDASSLHVRCVQRSDSTDPHARILSVGGRGPYGEPFRYTHEEAVEGIRHGRFSMYFDHSNGHDTPIVVARGIFSHYYLKGEGDLDQPDELLALPECPQD